MYTIKAGKLKTIYSSELLTNVIRWQASFNGEPAYINDADVSDIVFNVNGAFVGTLYDVVNALVLHDPKYIKHLQMDAAKAGDYPMVKLCIAALNGNKPAWRSCIDALVDAHVAADRD